LTPFVAPTPSALQLVPSQLASRRALTPPATVKTPPAQSRGPVPGSKTASESTLESAPLASGDQAPRFQRTMLSAAIPPISAKTPATKRLWPAPEPSSKSASAYTPAEKSWMPVSSDDHDEPSQRASRSHAIPPAVVKMPPAYSAGPLPSSWDARVNTGPSMPTPSADQIAPSHRAM
jgi:hypothetical protein